MDIDLADQIAEVKRELAQREHFYPKWVPTEKLTQAEADRRLARLRAVLKTLENIKAVADQAGDLFEGKLP